MIPWVPVETKWLKFYLRAAWSAGWEAHQRNPDMHDKVMLEETQKIAMMIVGLNPENDIPT